jgi:hypothetical protein
MSLSHRHGVRDIKSENGRLALTSSSLYPFTPVNPVPPSNSHTKPAPSDQTHSHTLSTLTPLLPFEPFSPSPLFPFSPAVTPVHSCRMSHAPPPSSILHSPSSHQQHRQSISYHALPPRTTNDTITPTLSAPRWPTCLAVDFSRRQRLTPPLH